MNKYFKFSYAIIVLILVIISGCSKYTQTKALEQVDKANSNYPAPVADWLRGKYPCITKAADTSFVVKDSVVYIQCPDLPEIIHMPGDTIVYTKTIRVPVNMPVRTQTITKYIEDSAKIKVMAAEISKQTERANYTAEKLFEQTKIANDTRKERNKWRLRFFILLAVFGGAIFLRIKRIL